MRQWVIFCVFVLCFSCDDSALLREYVNNHVISATFGGIDFAEVDEWGDDGAIGGSVIARQTSAGDPTSPEPEDPTSTEPPDPPSVPEREEPETPPSVPEREEPETPPSVPEREEPTDPFAPSIPPKTSELVEKLRSLSKARGRVALTPSDERDDEEPQYTVLKVTLNNERNTVYTPEFLGTDAHVVAGYWSTSPSVFYIKLNKISLDPEIESRVLDITMNLKAPAGYKPPDPVALPIECVHSSGMGGSLIVMPGSASVAKGMTQQFYAASPKTTWSLTGSNGSSSLDESGLLTVGTGETAETLTVEANATGFSIGTATVTVIGAWVAKLLRTGDRYNSIKEAIDAAENTDTIALLQDITIIETVTIEGKHINLMPNDPAPEGTVTISRSNSLSECLFNVQSGASLTLGGYGLATLVLDGGSGAPIEATKALVVVNPEGTLTMNNGATLRNNANTSGNGGGVYVDGGTFNMKGGTISGNTVTSGGGVYVASGEFNMEGGTIGGNTANRGGGVYNADTFAMSGGTISGNSTEGTTKEGGGVFTATDSNFTMSGGAEISGNEATKGGGVSSSGTFNMEGGTISGNTANSKGGGVYIYSGTFNMNSGTISKNTANSDGGGVHIYSGTFNKTGGIVYGSDDDPNANAAAMGSAVHKEMGKVMLNGNEVTLGPLDPINNTF